MRPLHVHICEYDNLSSIRSFIQKKKKKQKKEKEKELQKRTHLSEYNSEKNSSQIYSRHTLYSIIIWRFPYTN